MMIIKCACSDSLTERKKERKKECLVDKLKHMFVRVLIVTELLNSSAPRLHHRKMGLLQKCNVYQPVSQLAEWEFWKRKLKFWNESWIKGIKMLTYFYPKFWLFPLIILGYLTQNFVFSSQKSDSIISS